MPNPSPRWRKRPWSTESWRSWFPTLAQASRLCPWCGKVQANLNQHCRYRYGENPGRDDRYNNPGWSDNQNCEAWLMERSPGVSEANNKTPKRPCWHNLKVQSRGCQERFRMNQNRVHSKSCPLYYSISSWPHIRTQITWHSLTAKTWIPNNFNCLRESLFEFS